MNKYFLFLAATLLVAACTKEVHVKHVSLKPTTATLSVGSTLALDVAVEPTDAANKTVTWSTDNPGVATVNVAGVVTAIAPGTAKITATTKDGGFKATCNVTVEEVNFFVPVTGVSIICPEDMLLAGNALTLEAAVEPSEASNKNITWSTDDDRIATINSEGELTAIAPGTAKITVTTGDGGFMATCNVTVIEGSNPVTGVNIICPEDILLVGNTLTIEAAVEPADASNKTVTWSTDNPNVATVNAAGELTAIAPGTAKITVTTDDGGFTTTCTVTVEEENFYVPVTGLTLNRHEALLLVGKKQNLEAAVEPAEATNKNVKWTADDDRIATVNSAGEITAVAPGIAKITVTAGDGGFTASCMVTVSATGITMTSLASIVGLNMGITLGADYLMVDWGDGEVIKTYVTSSSNYNSFINVSHFYSSASEHHITITGNNIELFSCEHNQLTTFDASMNTALKELWCFDNQLTNLDVRGNTGLKELHCLYNQLTSLDLSTNTELTYLDCTNNQLTTLDVSRNSELKFLYCFYNQLTASALNDLFRTLPDKPVLQTKMGPYPDLPFTINIHENPGASDCDVSIAQEKGWRVLR